MESRVDNTCQLCDQGASEMTGPVYSKGGAHAHESCLYFGSKYLEQWTNVDMSIEPEKNFFYFKPKTVKAEYIRCRDFACCFCDRKNAACRCAYKNCTTRFHFFCGAANKIIFDYSTYTTRCLKHQKQQQPIDVGPEKNQSCRICWEEITNLSVGYEQLYCPNCFQWFHRPCIQKWALAAATHHLSCPICKDKSNFKTEMQRFGIKVPIADALWERDYRNHFAQLEEGVLMVCSAETCLCERGREYSRDGTPWDLLPCTVCGSSQAIHQACLLARDEQPPYECDDCHRSSMILEAQEVVQRNYRKTVKQRLMNAVKNPEKSTSKRPIFIDLCDDSSSDDDGISCTSGPTKKIAARPQPIPVVVSCLVIEDDGEDNG